MMKLFFASIFTALTLMAQAQQAYKIEGEIKSQKSGNCLLANYFGGSLYPKDTAAISPDGQFTFDGTTPLPQGLYTVVLPDMKTLIKVVIAEDQTFSFAIDTTDLIGSMRVKGSRDNEVFYGYQQFMKQKEDDARKLQTEKAPDLEAKFKVLMDERKAYHIKTLKDHAETLTVKFFKSSADPEVPPAPKLANGKPDEMWQFYYFKNHFFDDFDFTDERLLRTPFFQGKIDRYIKDLTVQNADSLAKSADWLVKKTQAGKQKDMVEYVIWYITNQYETTKIVGTEGLFIHMVEKYYLPGVISVSDTSTITSMKERLKVLKPLLVDKVIPDLGVIGMNGALTYIHQNPAPFKVIIFYAPSCGHCRESAPKVREFFQKNKLSGVQVMTISTQDSEADWKKFIAEYKWEGMINTYGLKASRAADYKKDYDVISTPTTYILDEKNRIIARKLGIEDLEPFMKVYMANKKKKK